jgi:tRNA-modifying protein YgfZ
LAHYTVYLIYCKEGKLKKHESIFQGRAILHYKTIACLGPDAAKFLQGQLSCDIREVRADSLSLSCYCNLKGRVIAAPYLVAVPEGFHLILPSDLAESFMATLGKYILFSKASLTDLSEQFPVVPILGESQYPIAPGMGFTLGGSDPAPFEAWQASLIEHKIPFIGLSQSGLFLPHDLGLVQLGAVSFTKGCYLGQEIIARMHYKAKLKKQTEFWGGTGPCPLEGEIVNEVIFSGKRYTLVLVEKSP